MKPQKCSRYCLLKTVLLAGLVSAAFFYPLAAAKVSDEIADRYVLDRWGSTDELPGTCISAIARTPDGYLWLATPKGLIRFDGLRFKTVRYDEIPGVERKKTILPDTLLVDRDGLLWIGSPGYLTRFDHKSGRFKSFTKTNGMKGHRIKRIAEDLEGNLWIGFTVNYLDRFGKSSGSEAAFTHYNHTRGLTGKKVTAIMEDSGGKLRVGTQENGLFTLQQGTFIPFPLPPHGPTGANPAITHVYQTRDNSIWVSTATGLLRRSPGPGKWDIYTTRHGLSVDHVTTVFQGPSGFTWVGTAYGLCVLRKDPAGQVYFETALESCAVTALFEDNEKSLWIGTENRGLMRLKKATFYRHTELRLTSKKDAGVIVSLYRDDRGDTWYGATQGKLYRYRDGVRIETIRLPGITTAAGCMAHDKKGNLWVGTEGQGALRRDAKTNRFTAFNRDDGLADNQIISIFTDKKNNTWLATYDGVSRYRKGKFKSLKTRHGITGNFVNNVYEDKTGNIWLATNKGLVIIKDGGIDDEKINMTVHLPDIPIASVLMDGDTAWLATHGAGLKRFKNGQFTSYTTEQGLSSNFVYQILEDANGYFWIMAKTRVLRVSKEDLNRFAGGRTDSVHCRAFGPSDGMKYCQFYNFFSRNSVMATPDGEFLFVARKGITAVKPSEVWINKTPPPVVIEKIRMIRPRGQEDFAAYLPLEQEQKAIFNASHITQFYFTAPALLGADKITFKFKLEGHHHQWHYMRPGPGRIRAVGYKDICGGKYTFRVTACNEDGVWNRTGASFSFTIKPYFRHTLLFKLLIAAGLLLLLGGAFLLYKKITRFKAERNKYQGSQLNDLYVDECLSKLDHLMRVKKVYLEENLTLQSLAGELSILPRYLSQIVNEKLNVNFPDYVNSFRVEEAKKLLSDSNGRNRKIIAIAFDVGFNTKAAFNIAFKKHTGMTPTQYRKTA